MTTTMQECSERFARAARLLTQAGLRDSFALQALHGGANSKAFRIDLASGGPALFFKEYFYHPDDPRDRLGAEFGFASFLWNRGLRTLAQPHAVDRDNHCALYAFLDGRKLGPHEIGRDAIDQCLRFFQEINAGKNSPQGISLAPAAEACFCLEDHWRCLRRRVSRLEGMSAETPIDYDAAEFIQRELAPACYSYFSHAQELAAKIGIDPAATISESDRCLSPSDFGFHNALASIRGELAFLDFEYAGWDDPAKTVCDFFCQPECPSPLQYYADFAARVASATSNPVLQRRRFDLLLPMYRLKWCCIMLNDFLPAGASRRRFAIHKIDEATRKSSQLNKARSALTSYLDKSPHSLAA